MSRASYDVALLAAVKRSTMRSMERLLLGAGSDLDDLQTTFTTDGARRLAKSSVRRANGTALLTACVSKVERCVNEIRRQRRGKL